MGIESARHRGTRTDETAGAGRRHRSDAVAKAAGDETTEGLEIFWTQKRLVTATEHQEAGRDRGRRLERAWGKPPRGDGFVRRRPDHALNTARPWHGPLDCDSPLHDEVCAREWRARVVEQQAETFIRPPKGKIRNHPERLARQRHGGRVSFDDLDVRPAPSKPRCE